MVPDVIVSSFGSMSHFPEALLYHDKCYIHKRKIYFGNLNRIWLLQGVHVRSFNPVKTSQKTVCSNVHVCLSYMSEYWIEGAKEAMAPYL